jgi:hypothetical protein
MAFCCIHFICRDRLGLRKGEPGVWDSGDWDLAEEDAARLVGGMIYLHQTKGERSYFGGCISGYQCVEVPDVDHERRVVFRFNFDPAARGVAWRGSKHAMAWTSGIVEA